jgi:hypothetical protein
LHDTWFVAEGTVAAAYKENSKENRFSSKSGLITSVQETWAGPLSAVHQKKMFCFQRIIFDTKNVLFPEN